MDVKRRVIIAVSGMVVLLLLVAVVFFRPRDEKPTEVASPGPQNAKQHDPAGADAGFVLPDSDFIKPDGTAKAAEVAIDYGKKKPSDFNYGRLPAIKGDANPQVKKLVESFRDKKHPERFSTLIQPPPFDAKAYQADPESYLEVVEPGRVFQTAQPGRDVPRLMAAGFEYQKVNQGEPLKLSVQAPPGAPVTFTSFDTGQFSNLLSSITIKAGKDGLAEAEFVATPGTVGNINVLAGSPLASGQVKFLVDVRPPLASSAVADGSNSGS